MSRCPFSHPHHNPLYINAEQRTDGPLLGFGIKAKRRREDPAGVLDGPLLGFGIKAKLASEHWLADYGPLLGFGIKAKHRSVRPHRAGDGPLLGFGIKAKH